MRAHRTRIVSAIASVLIVASVSVAGGAVAAAPAAAAPAVPSAVASSGSTGWGPAGTVATDSAVTVGWDESASPNAGDDTVMDRRDPSTVIAHTAGKTVGDISTRLTKDYKAAFASDANGPGLSMTVSQTKNLVSQGVTVTVAGARGGIISPAKEWVEVFQCWGTPGETAPDPEHCQTGVGGSDVRATDNAISFRGLGSDRLLAGGDWVGTSVVPFRAIDGTLSATPGSNPYFNRTSTNEFTRLVIGPSGAATRTFELQTTTESRGLGCGAQAHAPSTSQCWLVAVPFVLDTVTDLNLGGGGAFASALTPSLWAQRLQVKLEFADQSVACGDNAQVLSVGSELLSPAVASWGSGLCSATGSQLGYSKLADPQVRTAVGSGSAAFGFTTQPIEGSTSTLYAPTALSGVVIAVMLDYRPCGYGAPEEAIERCGYPDKATAEREFAKAGSPVTGIRLNPRLIAKLLTQSYGILALAERPGLTQTAPWLNSFNQGSLFRDKEFLALNPELKYMSFFTGGDTDRLLQTEILRSDAAAAVWRWILADTDARSFLDGCPDPYGAVINPFYSTRTYAECTSDASELEAAAYAVRRSTMSPETFDKSLAPTYPPADASYPTVLYAQEDARPNPQHPDEEIPVGTLVDLVPKQSDMQFIARSTLRAEPPRGLWCSAYTEAAQCQPPQWKGIAQRQAVSERVVFSITDAADAARYLLPTALLCDGSDAKTAHCVGADTAGLTKAANEFAKSSVDGVLQPAAKADYAGGAYPLTLPVYGLVNTQNLSSADAKPIADILEYAATSGQKPGTRPGELTPGYAPLTAPLVAQAKATVAKLRALTDPVAAAPAAVPAAPTGPVGAVPTTAEVPTDGSSAAPTAPPMKQTSAASGKTAATEIGFPQFGLATGVLAALAAGILSPVLGRRRKGGAA
ncbi:hypothetical protein [Leifsonia aquatica]|uniref:hypothetical protein n=1 Tax=Leifsonia aquatica TaxID=144185 RepID=UPI00046A9DB5|nr:hypothetical protein [Leifsonia aquatica]